MSSDTDDMIEADEQNLIQQEDSLEERDDQDQLVNSESERGREQRLAAMRQDIQRARAEKKKKNWLYFALIVAVSVAVAALSTYGILSIDSSRSCSNDNNSNTTTTATPCSCSCSSTTLFGCSAQLLSNGSGQLFDDSSRSLSSACGPKRADIGSGFTRIAGRAFASRSAVIARHGIAATSQPLVTQVALDVLKRGGTAVDAAIAANALQGLVEPTSNGVGGDLMALVWVPNVNRQQRRDDSDKRGRLYALNASGRSSQSADIDDIVARLRNASMPTDYLPMYGPLSVSVPGAVDGWFELKARFGSDALSMADLMRPAVGYAREGFPLTETIAYYWARGHAHYHDNEQAFAEVTSNGAYPHALDGFDRVYAPDDGKTPAEGQLFRNPFLADTLERIGAEGGREAFYGGELADAIADYALSVGCPLTRADFLAHRSTWETPINTTYRGYTVSQLPPSPQGLAMLQQLNILETFNVTALGHLSADYLHAHVEAKKLAFADRAAYYADPAFARAPIEGLLSKRYAAERAALIDMQRAAARVDAGTPRLVDGDTIYMTVADDAGMMVSLIQSNYAGFGSGLAPQKRDGTPLGFTLQNRGALFALEPRNHANVYAPHKRPFHTIIPAFVSVDDEPVLSFGVMGGAQQPQGQCQIVTNIVDFGFNIQEAGDAARYSHSGSTQPTGGSHVMVDGGTLSVESGVDASVRCELAARGHVLAPPKGQFGGYQAILYDRDNDVYRSASESRKDGQSAGY
jgi:gamma-glutamyltranspeptidase / glutathione hydrolase